MKTLQEQYNLIKEGKGHKGIFLTEAKKQFPAMLTNPMGFDEATKILKTRGVISENYVDLKPINTIEASSKSPWETKFAKFLAEEVKVEEKKPAKEVEEIQSHNYDYKDKSNLDNQIGQEVLNGIYFEAKENPDKSLDEIRKMVSKNLAKDGQHYMKNAAFGIKGLGYKETEVEEVAGKYASSGYSDKLKKLVKEFLVKEASEPVQLNVVFNNTEDYIRAKQWFSEESDFYASSEHDEFQTLSFEVADQDDADATERAIDQELQGSEIQSWRFELMENVVNEAPTRKSKDFFEDDNKHGIALHKLMRGKWDRNKALTRVVKEEIDENSFEDKMAQLRAMKDQARMGQAPSPKVDNKKQRLQQKLNTLKRAYFDLISDMEKESDTTFAFSGDWYQEQLDDLENSIGDIEKKIQSINENIIGVETVVTNEAEEIEPKPEKKKIKKESLDADLDEIDTQANIVAMEAKLDKISEMISAKMERLNMIEEDSNLAELVDKGKMKSMQKEIKILEKRKAKMDKIYEKATGKAYTKEMVDETMEQDLDMNDE